MLTAAQCRTVAYWDGDALVCPECVSSASLNNGTAKAIIEYTAGTYANGEGLYCEKCITEIIEPVPEDVVITIHASILRGEKDTLYKEFDSWLDSLSTIERVRSIAIDED